MVKCREMQCPMRKACWRAMSPRERYQDWITPSPLKTLSEGDGWSLKACNWLEPFEANGQTPELTSSSPTSMSHSTTRR